MSSGSDFPGSTTAPPADLVVTNEGLPEAQIGPYSDESASYEFVRPSAIARETISFPGSYANRDKPDVAEIVTLIAGHLSNSVSS